MKKISSSIAGIVLAATAAFAAPVQANLVTNGGFETGDFSGWAQTGDAVFDGVQCAGPGPSVYAGNCSAYFGSPESQSGIAQTIDVGSVGKTWNLSSAFLPDGGLLRRARCGGVAEASGSVAAQVRHQGAIAGLDQRRHHFVVGAHIVGKSVQQNHGHAARIARVLVADRQHGRLDRGGRRWPALRQQTRRARCAGHDTRPRESGPGDEAASGFDGHGADATTATSS